MSNLPRGVRNNNPGNIVRNSSNKWQGRVPPEQQTDHKFEQFISPEFGIRALAILLIRYQERYNLRTIESIITRYAPSTENDVVSYVRFVCKRMKRGKDDVLDLTDYDDLRPLVEAIIEFENAGYRYPRHVVDKGLELAGVVSTRREVIRTDTVKGSTVAAATTAVAAITPQLADLDWRVAVAVVVVVAVVTVVGVILWRSRRL